MAGVNGCSDDCVGVLREGALDEEGIGSELYRASAVEPEDIGRAGIGFRDSASAFVFAFLAL